MITPITKLDLKQHLKERIVDPTEYIRSVRGKPLKWKFEKLQRLLQGTDELWDWEWFGQIGPRPSYRMGWCVVRDGVVIASYCHSHS